MEVLRRRDHIISARLPDLRNLLQHLEEAWASILAFRRPIGSTIKRLPLRSNKNIQRPTALPGRGLHKSHVNFIHIGTLFPVYFDADKMLVQEIADLFQFERFPFHYMAPMAGRITNAQKNGLLFVTRL